MSKNSTTIFITQELAGLDGRFSKTINLPFIPKSVTINNIIYKNFFSADAESGISVLSTDMINTLDQVICHFYDEFSSFNPMTFLINKPIRGSVVFNYSLISIREGTLSFALTFRD